MMARYGEKKDVDFFQTYLADSFYHYAHNNAFNMSYSDMLGKSKTKQDNRTADEITKDVFEACGLSFKES